MIAQASLRERKKARTRASLREHALRLFREQGYQATTVEQIAAAAEVSPSTFFRYFPTKEDVVLQDDMDTRMVEAFARQPPELAPIAALRAAMREAWELVHPGGVGADQAGRPALHARAGDPRAGDERVRPHDQRDRRGPGRPHRPRARTTCGSASLAGAVVGVMMSVFLPGALAKTRPCRDACRLLLGPESVARIDEALALLEEGLPL